MSELCMVNMLVMLARMMVMEVSSDHLHMQNDCLLCLSLYSGDEWETPQVPL